MSAIPIMAAKSVANSLKMMASGSLHLRADRKGQLYRAADGKAYLIFRESVAKKEYPLPGSVLEVGFRLKVIKSSRVMHWIFQRVCILTTPFWSGFDGFVVKLWMVDPWSKSYLGIYQWSSPDKAQLYVDALIRVLKPLSTINSVWYKIYPETDLDAFLEGRASS